MKIKKCSMILCIICLMMIVIPVTTFAKGKSTGIGGIKEGMKNVGTTSVDTSSGIGMVINTAIRLIQVAGSGIALIMVTMLGIKYMLASANEKADVKKQAVPIIIGCVLLFAAVNIVAIIADVGDGLN